MSKAATIAPGLIRVPTGIANAYLLGSPAKWVLVDTGLDGYSKSVIDAAEQRFGPGSRPEAIVLTHGHFDHSANANTLAEHWGVSIYAHRLELPFVNGSNKYPPPDPTVGGFMSQVIRLFPNRRMDLSKYLRELVTGNLPWLPEWQIIETPGHTPGHVSFYRSHDGTLVAGDAFTTVNQDHALDMLTQRQQVWRPPTYYTCDWQQAEASVKKLAALNPSVLGAGHGVPMSGEEATQQLRDLAENFPIPHYGRYVHSPAVTNEQGIVELPPPVPDPVKRTALVGLAVAGAAATSVWLATRKKAA